MQIGIVVPQGWTGEYHGWEPRRAWEQTIAVARRAERVGFESVWVFDHFETSPEPLDELTFEAMTTLTAIAAATHRVRLGQLVLCAGYRNAALVAKMAGTLDVMSNGRLDLGVGAGWHEPEYRAYGFPFGSLRERLGLLADQLEILSLMLGGEGPATYEGVHAQVRDAVNLPRGLQQPRIPIIVGGNGPNVTWRLAARFADELNLDGLTPEQLAEALPVIRSRCEEIGRDPSSMRLSLMPWVHHDDAEGAGAARVEMLAAYRELGLDRIMLLVPATVRTLEAVDRLAYDARRAGITLAGPDAPG